MRGKTSDIRTQVAVVGAGFSGLQAALDVQESGLSCVLVEAHNRVGGKSMTEDLVTMDGVVELGPTWINDKTQPKMYALVQRYGLEVIEQFLGGLEVLQEADGTLHKYNHGEMPESADPKSLEDIQHVVTILEREAQKFNPFRLGHWVDPSQPPTIPDVSFEEWLRRNQVTGLAYGLMRWFCTGCFGIEPREIGMHYVLDMIRQGHGWTSLTSDHRDGAQYLKLKRGTTTLARHMADDLTPGSLILDAPIVDITQVGDKCTLTLKDNRRIECDKVILANATHTYTYINFNPPLPRVKRELATRTRRGRYAKSVLTYPTAWWRDMGLLGSFTSLKGPVAFTWDISRPEKGQYSIACFICGDRYTDHFAKTKLQRQQEILDHLAEMVALEEKYVVYEVIEYIEKDWHGTDFIEGAPMAAFGPGDWATYAPALCEPFRNVHFAGTETARIWKGYMEGAVEAGSRAASEVVSSLRPKARI